MNGRPVIELTPIDLQKVEQARPEVAPQRQSIMPSQPASAAWLSVLRFVAIATMLLIGVYACRHYRFTLSRLYGKQSALYRDINVADWPKLTVFVAAHNEEAVVADCLQALLATTYPRDRLKIVPVNDRSTDGTKQIIDRIAATAPDLIQPFHRQTGKPGKAAALQDALAFMEGDLLIVFDADYLPRPDLLKELVVPFFDPEVGAVMGRVVPQNVGTNLLCRLLDLERSGGYQVDQQARMNLKLVPQYGGTVGGIRKSALDLAGGWGCDTLAEDTDMTYRLMLSGWKTAYLNYAECYEEVPETWSVRARQLTRWAKGHDQTMFRCAFDQAFKRGITPRRRVDGTLLLGVFLMPALLLLGWLCSMALYLFDGTHPLWIGLLISAFAAFSFCTFGNFGVFFQIAVAVRLDGNARRLRLMPLNMIGFGVTIATTTQALFSIATDKLFKRELKWDKTVRFRQPGVSSSSDGLQVPMGISQGESHGFQ